MNRSRSKCSNYNHFSYETCNFWHKAEVLLKIQTEITRLEACFDHCPAQSGSSLPKCVSQENVEGLIRIEPIPMLLLSTVIAFLSISAESAKLPSWRTPHNFIAGTAPSKRQSIYLICPIKVVSYRWVSLAAPQILQWNVRLIWRSNLRLRRMRHQWFTLKYCLWSSHLVFAVFRKDKMYLKTVEMLQVHKQQVTYLSSILCSE